jgi:hypothetical protein
MRGMHAPAGCRAAAAMFNMKFMLYLTHSKLLLVVHVHWMLIPYSLHAGAWLSMMLGVCDFDNPTRVVLG